MGIALLLLLLFLGASSFCLYNIKKIEEEKNRKNAIISRARLFYSIYKASKELNIVKNICTYNFEQVLEGLELNTEIRLHINTIDGVPVDYILEVIEPTVIDVFKKDGIPTSTYALDKMELTDYYVNSKLNEFDISRFSDVHRATLTSFLKRQYGSAINRAGIFAIRKLCVLHKKELELQMVDEYDYKYWLKNTYMG